MDDRPEKQGAATVGERAPSGNGARTVGGRLRVARQDKGIGLRELARRINVSASLISQIERGKNMPSVGTLYALVSEIGVSLDSLFVEEGGTQGAATGAGEPGAEPGPGPDRAGGTGDPNHPVRPHAREMIRLASGVTWERLTSGPDPSADFLFVTYEPGGASTENGLMQRHAGREYGYVISGTLGVALGFERFELRPGDSIAFDSIHPHRLWTIGDEPVEAVWCVFGRGNLPETHNGRQ